MKYIVLEVTDHHAKAAEPSVREIPVLFPDVLVHAEVYEAIRRILRRQRTDGRQREIKAASAGFLSSLEVGGEGCCHGKSESLGDLPSRGPVDDVLISTYDYLHGIK